MTLDLTPLNENFAIEVVGVEIWSGLDDGQVRTLDDAWANQGVLVFRRQALSEEELVTFSRRFGTPDVIAGPVSATDPQYTFHRCRYDPDSIWPITYRFFSVDDA